MLHFQLVSWQWCTRLTYAKVTVVCQSHRQGHPCGGQALTRPLTTMTTRSSVVELGQVVIHMFSIVILPPFSCVILETSSNIEKSPLTRWLNDHLQCYIRQYLLISNLTTNNIQSPSIFLAAWEAGFTCLQKTPPKYEQLYTFCLFVSSNIVMHRL